MTNERVYVERPTADQITGRVNTDGRPTPDDGWEADAGP